MSVSITAIKTAKNVCKYFNKQVYNGINGGYYDLGESAHVRPDKSYIATLGHDSRTKILEDLGGIEVRLTNVKSLLDQSNVSTYLRQQQASVLYDIPRLQAQSQDGPTLRLINHWLPKQSLSSLIN